MKLLLDTCTFLCLVSDFEQIPEATLARLDTQPLAVSTLTLWEILIKIGKGRLRIDTDGLGIAHFWQNQCVALDARVLHITPNDILHLQHLPDIHRDPFDRLLICQAIEHGLAIVTPDAHIRQYPIKTLWD